MERKKEIAPLVNKSLELKKHVAMIHSSNKLTLLQRKIANALLFNAYRELQQKDEHEIHINKLSELIGYNSKDTKSLKNALVNLLSTVLQWNLVDIDKTAGEGVWNASSIIADASIDGAMCTYSYSKKMRELLYRPEMYGRLDMQVQAKFKSTYGLALYENCNRYQDIGKTPWFNMTTFRQLMGVEADKYKIFRDFKIKVLNKAVSEVNKYSAIKIEPQFKKQNRNVIAIQFLISSTSTKEQGEPVNKDVNKKLLDFGVAKARIPNLLSEYNDEYILAKINLLENSKSYKEGAIKNIANYLLASLKEDYQPAKPVKSKNKLVAIDKYELQIKKQNEIKRSEEMRKQQDKQIIAGFNELEKSKKSKLAKDFEKSLGRSVYHSVYLREGFQNILILDQLVTFLRQVNHPIVVKILSKGLVEEGAQVL